VATYTVIGMVTRSKRRQVITATTTLLQKSAELDLPDHV